MGEGFIHREIDSKRQSVSSSSTASVDTGTSTNRQCSRCGACTLKPIQPEFATLGRNQCCPQHEGCVHGACCFLFTSCAPGEALPHGRNAGWASSTRIPFVITPQCRAQGLSINKTLSLRVQVCVKIKNGRAEAFECVRIACGRRKDAEGMHRQVTRLIVR